MHTFGITGHTDLTEHTKRLVLREIVDHLRRLDRPAHGVSCLAAGADQVFVAAVTATGGTYDVILPCRDYRDQMINPAEHHHFDGLLDGAGETVVLPAHRSGAEAYAAANRELVARSAHLFAVWDGVPDHRPGTTAHAVRLAERDGKPVTVVWPSGARRTGRRRPTAATPARSGAEADLCTVGTSTPS